MLSSFSLSELLLCEASVWYPDEFDFEVPATLLLISLALDNVEGESAKETSDSPLLKEPDSVRRYEEGENAVVGTWVSEFAIVNVSDLKFVAVRRSLKEAKEGDCEK